MGDLEILINTLINLNANDELIINKSKFLDNVNIKNIIKKYRIDNNKIDNLYQFAIYIVKIKNEKLQKLKDLYNLKDIDNLIFSSLTSIENEKIHFFSSLIIRYLNYDIKYKTLRKFILILQNLDVKRI